MFSDKQKKWIKKGVLFLILLPIFLFLFVLPKEQYMIKDGGTMCYGPFLPVYEYRKVHGGGYVDKDGNRVFKVGTEVYIFGIRVYENTHYEAEKTGRRVEEDELAPGVRTHNTAISDLMATIP